MAPIEALEQRKLLAATLATDGTLSVSGTSRNDRITLATHPTELGVLVVTVNSTETVFTLGGVARVRISGGRGNDSISMAGLPFVSRIYGGPDDDTIIGGVLENRIYGDGGNDRISGGGVKDMLYGDAGDDFVRGGGGSDALDGGDGADTLGGDAGHDRLSGAANPDRLRGGAGNDNLRGGGGKDRLDGGDGNDRLDSGNGDDVMNGGEGNDSLFGGDGANPMSGGNGNDLFWAGAGDDTLHGQGGDDDLKGESGADELQGGAGNDDFYDDDAGSVTDVSAEDDALNMNPTPHNRDGTFNSTAFPSGLVVNTPGGQLDLTDNDLIVDYTGGVPPLDSGVTVGPGDYVIGKYTYFGDADFDGKVTADDYVIVDSHVGPGGSWIGGDFNMGGVTTGDDYLAIDANLGKGTVDPLAYADLKAEMIALHTAMFGEEYITKLIEAGALTIVPS